MLSRCASTAAIPCLSTHPHSSTDLRGDRFAPPPPLPHQVRVGNTVATRLPPFQLVGEASLLENLQSPGGTLQPAARATIVALPGAKYVRWSQRTFYELQERTHLTSHLSAYTRVEHMRECASSRVAGGAQEDLTCCTPHHATPFVVPHYPLLLAAGGRGGLRRSGASHDSTHALAQARRCAAAGVSARGGLPRRRFR